MQLYLGLDPHQFPHAIHYPVIRTELILSDALKEALLLYPQFTHWIFTSKSCVRYWCSVAKLNPATMIAIGEATADEIRLQGMEPLVARSATQEGVIELLETLELEKTYIFYPHSKKARSCLTLYLQKRNVRFFSLDLYDTLFQRPEPVPVLDNVDEIIFTSPSTVEGFLRIFKEIPKDKKLSCIGPITEREMRKHFI